VADRALRVCIDINIWVGLLLATRRGLTKSALRKVISAARSMKVGDRPVQLVMSIEMMDTLKRVIYRIGISSERAHEFVLTIIDLMKSGPEYLDPYLAI
jgi:hypothetical protein